MQSSQVAHQKMCHIPSACTFTTYRLEVCRIREFPWESHGNGKHRLNSREWEWWTGNGNSRLEEIPVSRENTYTSRLKSKGNTCLSYIIILCNLFVRAVKNAGCSDGARRRYSNEVITYYNLRIIWLMTSPYLV